MDHTPFMAAGERWAYFERKAEVPVEVEILRPASATSSKAYVRFVEGPRAGAEELVAAARLDHLWDEELARRAIDAEWEAAEGAAPAEDDFALAAADDVFVTLVDEQIAEFLAADVAALCVYDVERLAEIAGVSAELVSRRVAFDAGDDGYVLRWPEAHDTATELARAHADVIRRAVESEAAEAIVKAERGTSVELEDGDLLRLTGEEFARLDAEEREPVRRILLDWAAGEPETIDAETDAIPVQRAAARAGDDDSSDDADSDAVADDAEADAGAGDADADPEAATGAEARAASERGE